MVMEDASHWLKAEQLNGCLWQAAWRALWNSPHAPHQAWRPCPMPQAVLKLHCILCRPAQPKHKMEAVTSQGPA